MIVAGSLVQPNGGALYTLGMKQSCAWTPGLVLGAVIGFGEASAIAIGYGDLGLADRWRFVTVYGLATWAGWALVSGGLAAVLAAALKQHRVEQAEMMLRLGAGWDDNGLVCMKGGGRAHQSS